MSDNLDERTYYVRTVSMYMELVKETVIKVFKYLTKTDNITEFLSSIETRDKVRDLFKNDCLNKNGFYLVNSTDPNPEKFDIALLFRLIFGLCRDVIPKPKSGWTTKPHPKDESLGADLIRLRDVRNKLIGHHRKDARLSEAEYGKIWNKVQAILVRIAEMIDPEAKESMENRLHEYKCLVVDSENSTIKRHLDQLLQYENEAEQLQNKVEELGKISQGFKLYFENTPERYVRYIKLLFQGGRLVLCGVLERESAKRGKSLVTLLSENTELLTTEIDSKYQSYLFPPEPCNLDHTIWEVDLLASVILLVFADISISEIKSIERIQNARLSYAEHALHSLNMDKFLSIWTYLIRSLQQLSMNIDEGKKLELESLIDRYMENNEESDVDADEYINQLQKSGVPIKTLKDIHSDTVCRLRQLLRQLKESGIKFKVEHDFELKIVTTCKDAEKKRQAEDTLEKNLKASLHESPLPTNFIRMETDQFFATVTAHPDVKPTGVKRGCIIVSFKISSPDGLLHLLDYFASQQFLAILNNLSQELLYLYGDAFLVQGHVPLESLFEVIQNVECSNKEKTDKGLILPLKCSSVEGIEHVLSVLKSEKTTRSLNAIAEKISDKLEESVTFSVVPESLEFGGAFNKTDDNMCGNNYTDTKSKLKEECSNLGDFRPGPNILNTSRDTYENEAGYSSQVSDGMDQDEVESQCSAEIDMICQSIESDSRTDLLSTLPPSYEDYTGSKDEHYLRREIGDQSIIEDLSDDLQNDAYVFNLYRKAISEEAGSRIRINIVGNFSQGKTSLTRRLMGKEIDCIQSTNGIEINHFDFKRVEKEMIDYATRSEEEESESTGAVSNETADISINVETEENSTARLIGQLDPVQVNVDEFRRNYMRRYIEMNQTYTVNTLISRKKLNEFPIGLKEDNRCTPSTNKHLFDIWDFGGQFIFNATNTLFLSSRAVYLLVFDLSTSLDAIVRDSDYPEKSGDRQMWQFAKFWMNSIHSYVGSDDGSEPRVILVGTHKDKLKGDEHAKEQFKDEYFERVRQLFKDTVLINHIEHADYAVDNTDPKDISICELQKEIIRLGNVEPIPVRWIYLESALKSIRHEKIITFDKVMKINSKNECSLEEDQIQLFLKYYHSKGSLCYFDEEPISAYVVLEPQYLIDAFRCIITSERFCKKDPSCQNLWNMFRKDARLETELVEYLWAIVPGSDFLKHKRELLMFMQKLGLLSEVSVYEENSQKSRGLGWYVVPSLLRDSSTDDTLKLFLTDKRQTSTRFVMSFYDSPVLKIVYERLLAASIARWAVFSVTSPGKEVLLYENLGVFRLDWCHAGSQEMRDSNIELRVFSLNSSSRVDFQIADMFRRFTESVVLNEFKRVRPPSVKQKKPYTPYLRCNHESHGLSGSHAAVEIEYIRARDGVPCPDMHSHVIMRDEALSEWFQQDADRITILTPDCQLSMKQLSRVAQAIDNNWEFLGMQLGLNRVQIDHILVDFLSTTMRIYRMLVIWKDMEAERATVNALIQILKAAKNVQIDWEKIRNMIDEIYFERT